MLRKCLECSETWNKALNFFSQLWPPTLDILPGCWPRPHVLTLLKVSKNTQMNLPYHTESISQHVHHFQAIKFFWKKINYFPRRGDGGGGTPFAENSAKIINLIFETFPNCIYDEKRIFLYFAFSGHQYWSLFLSISGYFPWYINLSIIILKTLDGNMPLSFLAA